MPGAKERFASGINGRRLSWGGISRTSVEFLLERRSEVYHLQSRICRARLIKSGFHRLCRIINEIRGILEHAGRYLQNRLIVRDYRLKSCAFLFGRSPAGFGRLQRRACLIQCIPKHSVKIWLVDRRSRGDQGLRTTWRGWWREWWRTPTLARRSIE
jgi:hypothetical protein